MPLPQTVHEAHRAGATLYDLDLSIEGTRLEAILKTFRQELARVGLAGLDPQFYLATEWWVPFPSASIAIPFYLARPDLTAFHADQTGMIEGSSKPYARSGNGRDGIGGLNAGATYDPANELSVSFGGQGTGGGTNNLFLYDAHANRLHRIDSPGAPSPRDGMGLCCDPVNGCLVVFGSQYASDEKTYLFRTRTGKWEAHDLNPRPPGKKQKTYSTIPKMAYDAVNRVCLCVTWDDATGAHQTWALDVAALRWTQMNPSVEAEPSMSRGRNLAYSAEHNVFILETAPKALKGKGAEIWTYRYKKAAPDSRPASPAAPTVVTEAGKVSLSWTAVGLARKYHVYRSANGDPWKLDFAKVGETDRTTFEDRDAGRRSVYTVRAVAADGTVGTDSPRAWTTPRVPVQPVVSVFAADRVEVHWTAHPAADVSGYNVYRGLVTVKPYPRASPSRGGTTTRSTPSRSRSKYGTSPGSAS